MTTTAVLAQALLYRGDHESAAPLLDQLATWPWGRCRHASWAQAVAAHDLLLAGRIDDARASLDGLVMRARIDTALGLLALAHATRAQLHLWTGSWGAATADLRAAEEQHAEVELGTTWARIQLTWARLDATQGRGGSAHARVTAALDSQRHVGRGVVEIEATAVLGQLELAEGRLQAAADQLRHSQVMAVQLGRRYDGLLSTNADLVEAHVRSGDMEGARRFLRHFAEDVESIGHPAVRAAVARSSGSSRWAGPETTSPKRSSSAVAPERRSRWLAPSSCGESGCGAAATPGTVAAEDAAAAFTELDALPWLQRAQGAQRAIGSRISTRPRELAELTSQERAVADLVGTGCTNKEAAAALFLSVKTVEYHLVHVYRKLAVRSRSELAVRLGRTGEAMPAERPPLFDPSSDGARARSRC